MRPVLATSHRPLRPLDTREKQVKIEISQSTFGGFSRCLSSRFLEYQRGVTPLKTTLGSSGSTSTVQALPSTGGGQRAGAATGVATASRRAITCVRLSSIQARISSRASASAAATSTFSDQVWWAYCTPIAKAVIRTGPHASGSSRPQSPPCHANFLDPRCSDDAGARRRWLARQDSAAMQAMRLQSNQATHPGTSRNAGHTSMKASRLLAGNCFSTSAQAAFAAGRKSARGPNFKHPPWK